MPTCKLDKMALQFPFKVAIIFHFALLLDLQQIPKHFSLECNHLNELLIEFVSVLLLMLI